MRRREPDAFARAVYSEPKPSVRSRWRRWRRLGLPIAAAAGIVIAIAVITDLPTHESLAGEQSAGNALLKEINNDVSPCAFSINETNTIYRQEIAGKLSSGDRSRVPSLLQDDAAACSFTSDNVNDLADIEEPGTGAGRYLTEVVSLAQTWTTSDALGAIDDLISLEANPADTAAARDLVAREGDLAADRNGALAALGEADRYLHGTLPTLQIPAVRLPVPRTT